MKKLIVAILLLITFFYFGQDMSSPIPVDKDVKIGTLSNGLKYYIKKNAYPEKKVELRLVIKAGSIVENENQRGLAHFMEHMNFNGTKNFPKNELVSYLQSIGVEFGADLNAYTSFDETVYMLPIPLEDPKNLETGMLVLEDWAFNALLTDEDINEERGIILEEKRLRSGADERMMRKWLPIALKDSRYAERLPIGTDEVLQNFNPDVLRDFHKAWYRPDLMSVVVVGDIDVADIEKKIKAHFEKYKNPANSPERKYYNIPNYTSPNIAITSDKEAAFTQLYLMYFQEEEAKPMKTIGDYKKHLSQQLFSSMLNARFQEIGNGPNPPFTYAFSFYGGTFSDYKKSYNNIVSASEDKMADAFKVVLTENQRVKEHGFVESELERAKSELLSGIERQFNNKNKTESQRLVGEYINNFLLEEPIPGIDWEYEMYKKVLPMISIKEVNSLVDKFIQDQNYSLVAMGTSEPFTVDELKQTIASVKKEKLTSYKDDSEGLVLMEKTPKKGKIKSTSYNKELDYTTVVLKNGITVKYKKTDHKEDEILFRAQSYGGYATVSDEVWKKTHFAMDGISDAGVNNISNTNLDKLLAGKTVRVSPFVNDNREGMNGSSSIKDLETMFQLVNLYFTSLNYDEEAFSSFRQKQEGQFGTITNMPEFYFANELSHYVGKISNNPRVANIVPLKDDWKYTDYKAAYDLYKERFANPADFTFYFTGSIPEQEFLNYVQTYLGSLSTSKDRESFKELKTEPLTGVNEVEFKKGSETKSIVTISTGMPTEYNDTEALHLQMLGDVLDIVLTEKLREDEGGVYSLRAFGNMTRGLNSASNLGTYIPTGVDQYKEMRNIALEEIMNLASKQVSIENLNKVQEQLINNYKENIQTNNYWQKVMYDADFWKEDASEAFKYIDKVKAVTTKDLLATAKKYINIKSNLLVGILVPEVEAPKMEVSAAEVGDMNVSKVLRNYFTALTGEKDVAKAKKQLQMVKKSTSKGFMHVSGMEASVEITEESPNIFHLKMEIPGVGEMIQHYDDKEGFYRIMGGQKQSIPEAPEQFTSKKGIFDLAFTNEADFKLLEAQNINNTKYYVLQKGDTKYFFNAENGLIDQSSDASGMTKMSQYKKTNGIMMPYIIDSPQGKLSLEEITFE